MLRQGPVSAFVHAVLEYALAAVLLAAPFVLGFDSSAATALAVVAGVALLVVAATSDTAAGLSRVLPGGIHIVVDLVVAAVLIAAPFLFGFTGQGTATAFFIVVGVVHLLLALATRYLPPHAE